jgi:hypothetical protein
MMASIVCQHVMTDENFGQEVMAEQSSYEVIDMFWIQLKSN